MKNFTEFEITVPIVTRDDEWWCDRERLLDALAWDHYPTNVSGEEIDTGNDSDEARAETIEVPNSEVEVYEFLLELGVFDF